MLRLSLCLAVAALALPLLAETPTGKKHALIVGVSKYDSAHFPALQWTENDAEKMANLLEKQGWTVRVLTNARGARKDADMPTAENIRKEIDALADGKKRSDLVLLALSGHGIQLAVDDPDEKGKPR